MRELYKFCRAVVCLAFIIPTPFLLFSQRTLTAFPNTSIGTYISGFYVSLPASYGSTTKNYPLLIFLHGIGEIGNGSPAQLPAVLRNGTPMQINQQVNNHVDAHFPDPVVVHGNSYEFIVIAPQMNAWPPIVQEQQMVDDIMNYANSHYRVDASKISLTGLSMGGGIAIEYPGLAADPYGKKLASLLGVAIASFNENERSKQIAMAHLPVWLTANDGDTDPAGYATGYYNQLIALNADPAPELTILHEAGHGGWVDTYGAPTDGNGAHPGITNGEGLNVYQWMAQYKRVGNNVLVEGISIPLPVTWGPYSAQLNGTSVTVSWSTLQEENNRYFVVQRSGDGQSFIPLDTVAAVNGPHSYSYADKDPLAGSNYYRLLQVDLDGRTDYSGIMNVNVSGTARLSLKPNPSSGIVYLEMINAEQGRLEVGLTNTSGQLLRKWSFDKQATYWTQAIDPGQLSAGTYFITIKGARTKEVRSFVRTQK
ncbi:MAG TPA: T9SS type A sorting domain-containing protein [Puia sp.]|jgi:hypothetical protein